MQARSVVDELLGRALARFSQSPQEQLDVEKRLGNWRRWLNEYDSGGAAGTCGSAERRYRSEKLTEAESQARSMSGSSEPVNVTDAERVDRALHQLPTATADLLRSLYYRFDPPWRICKVFDIQFLAIEHHRLLALLLLKRRLSLIDLLMARRKCFKRGVDAGPDSSASSASK